jgi:hypothetical protein
MFDPLDGRRLDRALRDGLRALPVPEASPDFDARVLLALRAPQPWWRRLWQPARPLLLGASCSLAVTLVLLHWTLSAPTAAPRPPILGESERPVAAPARAPSLDAVLDRPDLRAGSLAAVLSAPLPAPPDRRPDPPRHAQVGRRVALVA